MRIGLLGASRIAPQAIIDPARIVDGITIAAIGARGIDRAQSFADLYGIPTAYGCYEDLMQDTTLDVIYIGLPPAFHANWALRAFEAGKHVICEKPLAMNRAEAQQMVSAAHASGKRLIEAIHTRYHPAFKTCLEWVRNGLIGDVQNMQAHFNAPIPDDATANQRRADLGGGCIMDLGCYPLHWVSQIAGCKIVDADVKATVAGEVDESVSARLQFENGATADIMSSMNPKVEFGSGLCIKGTLGLIRYENLLTPDKGGRLTGVANGQTFEAAVSGISTYCFQMQAIRDAFQQNRILPTENDAILEQQSNIDLLYAKSSLGNLR